MVQRAAHLRLTFLDLLEVGGRGVRGIALVTDARTVPVELRVTDPVVPTQWQRALYGAAFDDHAVLDLVALPLVRALREESAMLLVRAPRLLRVQERVSMPVLWLGRQDDLVPIADAEEPGFLLAARDNRFPPVVALGFRGRHEETRVACELLQRVLQRSDILEPFARIRSAFAQLEAGEVGADGVRGQADVEADVWQRGRT
ncbi:MAG: hypothetical protein R3F56_14045 [Planctomycetota bacterium]